MNETLKVLTERRSVRSYKDAQVPEETLQQILTAGEYAPQRHGNAAGGDGGGTG